MKRILLFVLLVCLAESALCKIITREDAMRLAFPGAEIQSSMVFLTDQEMKTAAQNSGVPVTTALVASYKALRDGKIIGRAYLDTHVVRTKKESLLVILDAEGKVKRVEVVAFLEPPEYMPPDVWYKQFEGKALSEQLQIKKDIHPVTGATLTAQSTTDAVRRALAIDQILRAKEAKKP